MNIKHSKQFLSIFSTFLLLGTAAYANEEVAEEQPVIQEIVDFSDVSNKTGLFQNSYRAMNYRFSNVQSNGSICLDDGSLWTVSSQDAYKLGGWAAGDNVVIGTDMGYTAAVNAGRIFLYGIVNKSTGSVVRANLFQGSIVSNSNPKYLSLVAKNNDTLQITLNDGTSWIIAQEDKDLFSEWVADNNLANADTIIRGKYEVWFSNWDILINVPSNHYVRARQI